MFKSNYHSHCSFCDGRSSMEDFVKFAIAKGLKKYGFSSHAPLPFRTFWNMNVEDFPDYVAEFRRLRKVYASQIDLFLGMEADYIHNFHDIASDLYSISELDYQIGSVHYMDRLEDGRFWCIDGNFDDFKSGLLELFGGDIRKACKRYYEIVATMIEKGGFDIVGHLDKIGMNGSLCEGFSFTADWYRLLVCDILDLIKQKNFILEINTKSLNDKFLTYPNQLFYSTIRDLNIPIVVNSDCHYPTNIISGFDHTYRVLKSHGFRTQMQLTEGKWEETEF